MRVSRLFGEYSNVLKMIVFNFFEPLHYFQHNEGFQTWELSPQFAIRSWAYVLLHWPLASLLPRLLSLGKVSCVHPSTGTDTG